MRYDQLSDLQRRRLSDAAVLRGISDPEVMLHPELLADSDEEDDDDDGCGGADLVEVNFRAQLGAAALTGVPKAVVRCLQDVVLAAIWRAQVGEHAAAALALEASLRQRA